MTFRLPKTTAVAFLIITVLLVFSNSLSGEFVWDDKVILNKELFTDWNNVGAIMSTADTAYAGDNISYYRPLTYLTFLWDYQVWALKPFWYFMENVLLHALVAVLLYLLISRISRDYVLAFLSSLLFAVHPAVTEPVNFIAGGRNTLLCAAFSLGSLLFLYRSRGKAGIWTVLSLMSFFLALLSKEQAVVIPLFLLAVTFLSRSSGFRVKAGVLPGFFAVAIGYLLLRFSVLGSVTSQYDIALSPEYLGMIASALAGYFRIMLYPVDLNIEYDTVPAALLSFKTAAAASGMVLLVYAAVRRKTDEILRLSCIWLVLSFLPVSNIIPIPSAPVADRYIYIPLLGMCPAAGYLVRYVYGKRQTMVMVLFVLLIIVLGLHTYERNSTWQTEEKLWLDVAGKSPGKAVGYYNLGVIYGDRGLKDEAAEQYLRALQKEPDYILAHINLGIIYHSQGNFDMAIKAFETAVTLQPDFAKARYNLGLVYHSRGQLDMAIEQYRTAINISPDYAEAHNNLGSAYRAQGNMSEAIRHYQTAVKINPASANAHNNLGSAYMSKGLIDEAMKHFRTALAVEPGHAKARANLNMASALRAYSIKQQEMMRQKQGPKQ